MIVRKVKNNKTVTRMVRIPQDKSRWSELKSGRLEESIVIRVVRIFNIIVRIVTRLNRIVTRNAGMVR